MGMAVKNPVIVMALYDIGRDGWNSFGLSYDTYLSWMRNTLSLDSRIVVYTEDKFTDRIESMRREFDPEFKDTVIVEAPLEELECYRKYHDRLSNLMFSDEFRRKTHSDVPEMNRPLYNVMMFNKLRFLKDTKDKGYFDNDLLIWADAGGLRESLRNYRGETWPSLEKINQLDNSKVTFFSHSRNIVVNDREYHALSQIRFIQGTSFLAPSPLVDGLMEDFENTVDECLERGYIGSDEKIFDMTYCKDRDRYNLIKCTWRTYFSILKEDGGDLYLPSNSNKVFLDLGSYECRSIREGSLDEGWEVHAFEPNGLVDTHGSASQIGSCRVTVHKKAVWIRDGKTILNRHGSDGRNQGSLLEETGEGRWYADYHDDEIVKSVDLWSFVKSFDEGKEIYIHMDIEFSEYEVLEDMLKRGWPRKVKKLWVEWHGLDNQTNKARASKISADIRSLGTEVVCINHDQKI